MAFATVEEPAELAVEVASAAAVAVAVEELPSAESVAALYLLLLVSSEGTIPLLLTLE